MVSNHMANAMTKRRKKRSGTSSPRQARRTICGQGARRPPGSGCDKPTAGRGTQRVFFLWLLPAVIGLGVGGLGAKMWLDRPVAESTQHIFGSDTVAVTFRGEVNHLDLFGDHVEPPRPIGADGRPEGSPTGAVPVWLRFDYRINADSKTVLVLKYPIANRVSWDAIARAGAALGGNRTVYLDGREYPQNARIQDIHGNTYEMRLMTCGRSTMAHLSEWNLLIGGVHAGDTDFRGKAYGWIRRPYSDADLKVGFNGSLNWCQERWRPGTDERVLRGYFRVSRFHAAESSVATDRIHWRPVLELIGGEETDMRSAASTAPAGETSPNRMVTYLGIVGNAEIFGESGVADSVDVAGGQIVGDGRPDWLRFRYLGKDLLVATGPIKRSVSWNDIARAGAALGEAAVIYIDGERVVQDAMITSADGARYRVRLPDCGEATLDARSEWNALIGGVHVGDGDFIRNRGGTYGWVETPLFDEQLHIGDFHGAASWCRETQMLHGTLHAVNRGYLTVSRFHLTEASFHGSGFGWRPVLERVD